MFMAYNNGISTVADSISADPSSKGSAVVINEIKGWQIVNGGQTTASIYNAFQSKLPLEQVFVQIKLTVIKKHEQDEDITHNISQYANSQNKINMSDFNANDPYHVKMEQISRTTFIPVARGKGTEQWFYERARGQYLVELNRQLTPAAKRQFKERCPRSRCISKTVAAKCVMAWLGYPDIVLPKYKTVVFIHGCFWHQHKGCKAACIPGSRQEYWIPKLQKNVERDKKLIEDSETTGWKVIIIWECEIKKDFQGTMDKVIAVIRETKPQQDFGGLP